MTTSKALLISGVLVTGGLLTLAKAVTDAAPRYSSGSQGFRLNLHTGTICPMENVIREDPFARSTQAKTADGSGCVD
jgi:hypothetical protein